MEPFFYVAEGNRGSEVICEKLKFAALRGEGFVWVRYDAPDMAQ